MQRTVVSLYDNIDVAEQVIEELLNNQVPGESITMVVNDEEEYFVIEGFLQEEADYDDYDTEDYQEDENAEEMEMQDLTEVFLEMGLAEDEAGYYVDEVGRGRALVMINTPDDKVDRIRLIVNQYFPVDVRDRPQQSEDVSRS